MINNLKRGFTLVEMLVAVVLLTTALTGPLTIASKGITASIVAKDQIIAFYLAQDAVEYIRYKRDSNRLAGNSWLAGLDNCISTNGSKACILDSTENSPASPTQCGSLITCAVLRYSTTNSRFTYSTTGSVVSPISLRRAVVITTPVGGSADEISITVNVTWSDQGGITRTVSVRENLLNWQ